MSLAFSRVRRLLAIPSLCLALMLGAVAFVVATPLTPAANASTAASVATGHCRALDPNLVRGACLRVDTKSGPTYTWIGTYRAPDGRVFFCIDYLYDSRLPRSARLVPTERLKNQLGQRVGAKEVAALNSLISRWARHGSTGSDTRDAAIALIIREVMGDGVRRSGLTVYPRDLEVGERVQAPKATLDWAILSTAQEMWDQASRSFGPYTVSLQTNRAEPIRLGQARGYRLSVRSATGKRVPGLKVKIRCRGPIRCPRTVTTTGQPSRFAVRPKDTGKFQITASTQGPAANGVLFQARGWHSHSGRAARNAGIQRGWIARSNPARASISAQARIIKAKPKIATEASQQVAEVGAQIHDTVTVSGTAGAKVTGEWTLHGPIPDRAGSCDGLVWTGAPVAASGTFPINGDQTVTTPTTRVTTAGCYTYSEAIKATDTTEAASSPPGLALETVVVRKRQPRVTTVASTQRALTGGQIRDTVHVTGLASGDAVTVRWRLHGPIAAKGLSCDELDWRGAKIADSGESTVRTNGRFSTRPTTIWAPGCYTYSETVPETPTTYATATEPGIPAETGLFLRPSLPRTPEVPSGMSDPLRPRPVGPVAPRFLTGFYRAPTALVRSALGNRLEIPAARISAPVDSVGMDGDVLAIPGDTSHVGWLTDSAAPTDVMGTSVISGHVSNRHDRPGALWRLRDVRIGDRVWWTANGKRHAFKVVRRATFPRAAGVPAGTFRTDGAHTLQLITCTDRRALAGGGFHYARNLVVTAVAVP